MLIEIIPPTLISEGTRVEGDLTFFSKAQVFGTVNGGIQQQSLDMLQIGKSGWVFGSISSQGPVHIDGKVEGSVFSAVQIRLSSTAKVRGELKAPSIEIKPGARFDGDMKMEKGKTHSENPSVGQAA